MRVSLIAFLKADLTENSQRYIQLLKKEVVAKQKSSAASLEAMRLDVKAASSRVNDLKLKAMLAKQGLEMARLEVSAAKHAGDATRLQRAEKNLLLATEKASITRKAVLAANTEFLTKKKALETAATRKSILVSNVDTVSKTTQSAATTLLSTATNKAALAVRTLWASMKANPIGWLVSLVGLAVSAFSMFSKKKEEEISIDKQINDQIKEETGSIGILIKALNGAKDSTYLRKQVLEKLNPLLSKYNLELLNESDALSKINEQYQKLEIAITASNVARLKEQEIKRIDKETNVKLEKLSKNTTAQLKEASHTKEWDGSFSKNGSANYIKKIAEWAKKLTDTDYKFFTGYLNDLATTLRPQQDKIYEYKKEIDKYKKESENKKARGDIKGYNESIKKLESATNGYNETIKKYDDKYRKDLESIISIIAVSIAPNDKKRQDELKPQIENAFKKAFEYHKAGSKNIYKDDTTKKDDFITKYPQIGGLFGQKEEKYKQKPQANEQTLKQQQELAQKQLEADLRLEQSRIDIMDDGYEKRVAQATFQHKQNIAAINKEEQDVKKAYESMDTRMPTEYKDDFAERRVNEETLLTKQINSLFSTQLEDKKQQYELYYKWVAHVGKEAADKQFAELLKNGDSYKQYIQKQIAALEQKKASIGLTPEETNKLIGLKANFGALTNQVNPLDAFTAGLQESLSGASNLAEELGVVLEKKKELEEGKSGIINKDQLDSAKNMLEGKQHEINKQLQQKLLTDFKSYQEKKLSIEKYYGALLAAAKDEGTKERVKKEQAAQLSALNASMLTETESWKNLFSDLDSLSVDAIGKLIEEIETKMANANLQLNPADLKALQDRLDEARAKLIEKSPFSALGHALTEVFKKTRGESAKTAADVQRDWANLANASKGSFSFISSIVADSQTIKDMLGDSAQDLLNGLQSIDKAMQGVATLGASLASGNTFGVIAGGLQLAVGVADFINNIFTNDKSKEKGIESLQKGVQALQRDYERLGAAIQNTYSSQVFALMNEQDANLRQQQEELKKMEELEKRKKHSDTNKIGELQNQQENINKALEENQRKRMEMLAGTDVKSAIDQFGDALVEAYIKGENAAEKLGEVTKKVMKKAVVDAIKRQFLAKGIEEATKYLGEAMSDGVLSESERQRFQDMVKAAGDRTQAALEATGGWLKDDEATKQDSLTGAIKGVTEDTASIIAGRLNQMAIYQTDGLENMRQALLYHAEVAANTRNIAITNQALAATNQALQSTNETLKRIEDKINSNPLLSQGVS